jgi:hypothetical protein
MKRELEVPDAPWGRLPAELRRALEQAGWTDSRVLIEALESQEEIVELVNSLLPPGTTEADKDVHVQGLVEWKHLFGSRVDSFRRSRVRSYRDDLVGRPPPLKEATLHYNDFDLLKVKPTRALPTAWSSCREQLLSTCEDPRQRERVEEAERTRWLTALASALLECKLPITKDVEGHPTPLLLLSKVFGARRSRTLRRRYKFWKKMSDWFKAVFQVPFPQNILQLLSFADDLFTGKVGKTVPNTVTVTLKFMELAGGVKDKLSEHPLWVGTAAAATANAQRGNTVTKRAPLFSTAMIISLELLVTGKGPRYRRALAWLRLVKVWAGLRGGDVQGIDPVRLVLGRLQLKGILVVTKTTGPGKRVLEVPFFVHRQASLSGFDWLQEGLTIWQSPEFSFSRDYFVPRCGPGEDTPLRFMADDCFMAGYNRSLLVHLRRPRRHTDFGWFETPDPLLVPLGQLFWAEHSERHYLPSLSAAAKVLKELRDYIGRWALGQHQSNEYVLSAQQVIREVQETALKYISEGTPGFDETELLDKYRDFLVQKGYEVWDAQEAADNHVVLYQGTTGLSLHQHWPMDPDVQPEPTDPVLIEELNINWEADEPFAEWAPAAPYFVSISDKKRLRRLHKSDVCSALKHQCRNWEEVQTLDEASEDSRCKRCFPLVDKQEATSSGDESSASSSSEDPVHIAHEA